MARRRSRPRKSLEFSHDEGRAAVVTAQPLQTYCCIGRKVMTNLDSIFKSRDITLPTKGRLVKAMVFPVVM